MPIDAKDLLTRFAGAQELAETIGDAIRGAIADKSVDGLTLLMALNVAQLTSAVIVATMNGHANPIVGAAGIVRELTESLCGAVVTGSDPALSQRFAEMFGKGTVN